MNKKTMTMRNTQLTLFVVQCILKVDARGSKKSHEIFWEKENNLKTARIWTMCLDKKWGWETKRIKVKIKFLKIQNVKKKNETLMSWFNETRTKLFLKTPI